MDGLPRELWLNIFHLLDHQSLAYAPQVCRKWRELTSDDELWRKLFNDRWGADAAAFHTPEGDRSWKDVFVVQDRCDRSVPKFRCCQLSHAASVEQQFSRSGTGRPCISFLIRGVRIIYYLMIYQGEEIQRYLGSRQDTDTDGDCGKNDACHGGRASADIIGRQTC